MTQLTVGSLFSGIGGLDLGLERAGMQIKWQVEIDDYATRVLAKHWPDVARFRDVRECGKHNLSAVDVIAGGFPCQPHSLAGQRRASDDERNLWPEFYRIVCELRPRYVVAENVLGLLSSESGHFFGSILRDLAACGYTAEWQVLSADAVGAPHIRERIFLVAYTTSTRRESIAYAARLHDGLGTSGDAVSDANRDRCGFGSVQHEQPTSWPTSDTGNDGTTPSMAHADFQGLEVGQVFGCDATTQLTATQRDCSTGTGQWATEPDVGRVADGVPRRVDRLRGLGNAVVPQVAEYVGRLIVAHASQAVQA